MAAEISVSVVADVLSATVVLSVKILASCRLPRPILPPSVTDTCLLTAIPAALLGFECTMLYRMCAKMMVNGGHPNVQDSAEIKLVVVLA